MCLRISSPAFAALAAAACAPSVDALPGEVVECARGHGADLAPICTLERASNAAGFVLHHPGGGFRRVRFDAQAPAITLADGAEQAATTRSKDGHLVVVIGADRYRIPLALMTDEP